MKWKWKLTPGAKYDEPVSLMDIFTTAFSSCHLSLPQNIELDGVDLMPYLSGEKIEVPHKYLFWCTVYNKAVRNGQWKLIINPRDNMLMLYDLETDKQEQYDLNGNYPKIVTDLLSKIVEWEKEMIPPSWPGVMECEEEIEGVKMRFAL